MWRFADDLPFGDQLRIRGAKTVRVLHEFCVIRLERHGEGHRRDIGRSTAERDDASPIPSLEPGHDRYRATLQEPGYGSVYFELQDATGVIQLVRDFQEPNWIYLDAEPATEQEREETKREGFIFESPKPRTWYIDGLDGGMGFVLPLQLKLPHYPDPIDGSFYRYSALELYHPPRTHVSLSVDDGAQPEAEQEDGPWDYPDDDDDWDAAVADGLDDDWDDGDTMPGLAEGPVEAYTWWLNSFIQLCDRYLAKTPPTTEAVTRDYVRVVVPMCYPHRPTFSEVIRESLEYRAAMWLTSTDEAFIDRWAKDGAVLPEYCLKAIVEILKQIAQENLAKFQPTKENPVS